MTKRNDKQDPNFFVGNALVAQLQSTNDRYDLLNQKVPGTEVTWGTIIGNIEDQTDLVNFVNELIQQALTGDIEIDLSKYALKTDLETLATKEQITTLESAIDAIKVPTKVSELVNDAGYLTEHQDISNLAQKSEVDAQLALKADKTELNNYTTTEALNLALQDKADKTALVDLASKDDLATKADISALDAKADKTELANYASTEAMNAALETKAAKSDFDALKKDAVIYKDYTYNDEQKRGIELANNVNIVGVDTKGEGNSLVQLSKWDVADFGSVKVHCNLNTKDLVTVNDKEAVLTNENANQFIQQGNGISITQKELTYPDTEIKYHVLEVASTVDTSNFATKDELTAKADTAALDAYATTEAMNSALANKADTSTLADYVTTEANTEALELKADAANVYTKAEVDAKLPVCVDIPIRTLKDQIYEKTEILGWFGVEDEGGLKALISGDIPLFLKYGISLSTNPHYYKMPIQYIAFESDTQVKLVTIALDTTNDVASKYEIVMNLDGAIIESSTNVKMTITALEGNFATKEELANKADTSALATKADTSALEALQQQLTELTARVEALESPSP